MSGTVVTRPKGWRLFVAALRTRKSASMLAFGFSSGLPNALLIGTLTAWLGEVGVKMATNGCGANAITCPTGKRKNGFQMILNPTTTISLPTGCRSHQWAPHPKRRIHPTRR